MKFLDKRYNDFNLKKDISSGITVGIVAVPLAMAFAIASGLAPIVGLYTAIIAGALVSIFGGSKYQIAGPTGAFIPLVAGVLMQYNYEGLLITTFLSGIIILLLSFLKVGKMIKFMPISVTVGFTAGIAIVIFTDQLDEFLGITYKKHEHFHQNLYEIIKNIDKLNLYAIITALLGFLTIYLILKFKIKLPVLLTALIVPTLISTFIFPENSVATIGSVFGELPNSLPSIKLLNISIANINQYIFPALTIAFLGILESLLSASVADSMTGAKMNPDKELFGQGLANMITPLFGGMPSTGAIARTATNIQSGATSPLSGIVHSIVVLICVIFLSPLAKHVPLAALSPILMRVAFNMSERHHVIKLLKTKSGDSLVLVITMLLTVFLDLTVAVGAGIILSLLMFIRQMAIQSQIIEELDRTKQIPEITIITFKGPLFFGATSAVDYISNHNFKETTKIIILNMYFLPIIDITAAELLHESIKNLKKEGYEIYLSHIPPRVYLSIEEEGIISTLGKDSIFYTTEEAISFAKHKLNII